MIQNQLLTMMKQLKNTINLTYDLHLILNVIAKDMEKVTERQYCLGLFLQRAFLFCGPKVNEG